MHPHDGGLSPDSDVGTLAPKDRKLIPGPVTILVRLSLASLQDLGSVRGCTNSGQPHWSLVVQLVLDAMPVGSTQVRVKPGETYRQPQATSFKLDNRSGIV